MMDAMATAIEADGVSVAIDGQVLLPPTSAVVPTGGVLAVRGPNGAGKTTFLRVLAGLTTPSTGTVAVLGRPVDERSRAFRSTLAALIGPPAFARELTVREQLRFVAATWGSAREQASSWADELMVSLGIERLAQRFTHELSSGQLQLFSVALTLARPCEVLLLDEPEQRLDAGRRGLVAQLLRRVVDRGTTLVFSSHDGTLVDELADDVVTIDADR